MEFDKSRVYTALNADELKIGSKVVVADNITSLKERVESGDFRTLIAILTEHSQLRFSAVKSADDVAVDYDLAYLVFEPEEKRLRWQDVQIGDVLCRKSNPDVQYLVTAKSFNPNTDKHIFAADAWIFDTALAEQCDKVEDNQDEHE